MYHNGGGVAGGAVGAGALAATGLDVLAWVALALVLVGSGYVMLRAAAMRNKATASL